MFNAAHILETALIMLAAFLVGAVAGAVLRLGAKALRPKQAAATASAVTMPDAAAGPALVTAPVIDPIVVPAVPVASKDIPVPDFAETMIALANAPMPEIRQMPAIAPLPRVEGAAPLVPVKADIEPARTAGETTAGRHIASLVEAEQPKPPVPADITQSADILPFSIDAAAAPSLTDVAAELESLLTQAVAADAEAPKPSSTSSDEADKTAHVVSMDAVATADIAAEDAPLEPAAQSPVPAVADEAAATDAATAAPEAVETVGTAEPDVPAAAAVVSYPVEPAPPSVLEQDVVPEAIPPEEVAELALDGRGEAPIEAMVNIPVKQSTPLSETLEPLAAKRTPEEDEAAAMRAIEGNWSPRHKAGKPRRAAPVPDGIADAGEAVRASAAAVAAAAVAANAVVEAMPDPNRPAGISAPRDGRADELTNIIGILPIIETALNTLGIYHFDQVAELTDPQLAWVETHLGIDGRIGREHWREQAVELAALAKVKVAVAT